MKSLKKLLLISLASFVLFACSDNDDDPSYLQIIHASSNSPTVDILVNGAVFNNLTGVDYKVASSNFPVGANTYSVQVDGILPDASRTTVIGPVDVALEENTDYKIVAINDLATIKPLVVSSPSTNVASSEVRVQVIHASPDASLAAAGNVDVYVTAPNVALADADPLGSFDLEGVLGPVNVASGDYRIRITPAGSSTVVFDTGSTGVALAGGSDLTILAVDNTTTSNAVSPVSLLVLDDNGVAAELVDTTTQAFARVVHISPDADTVAGGDVEVFATTGGTSVELIPAFGYTDIVPAADDYVGVDGGIYTFTVAADGQGVSNGVFTSGNITLDNGKFYSVFAVGDVASSFNLLATEDNNRSVATEAQVKVVHAAEDAGLVSVYVTAAGDFTTTQIENDEATPLLTDFAFESITDYVPLAAGSYDIRVVPNSTGTVAIDVTNFALVAGDVVTVIARQPNDSGTPTDFNVIVLSN